MKKILEKVSLLGKVSKKLKNEIILIYADLEYDPSDYEKLLRPIKSGIADVVYGSRFIGSEEKRVLYFWHMIGNKFLLYFLICLQILILQIWKFVIKLSKLILLKISY